MTDRERFKAKRLELLGFLHYQRMLDNLSSLSVERVKARRRAKGVVAQARRRYRRLYWEARQ